MGSVLLDKSKKNCQGIDGLPGLKMADPAR
jgi:hypothetical protein